MKRISLLLIVQLCCLTAMANDIDDNSWTDWKPWNNAGTATYVYNAFWNSKETGHSFVFRQNVSSPDLYQFKMSDWAYGVDLVLDYNATTGHVTCAPTYTGYDVSTYGQLYVADYNTYNTEVRGKTPGVDFTPTYGSFDKNEGIITIPLSYFVSISNFGSDFEYIYIDGYIRHDVSCSVSYGGKFIADDGSISVVANVELGANVTSALVALVPGNLTDEVKAAIIAGEYENIVEISESGEVKFPTADMTDGAFTFVVVTYINGDAKNYDTVSFKYETQPEAWKSLGMCTYTEDCFAPLYRDNDDNPIDYTRTYKVEIQENQNMPGLYRLVNPYGEAYPFNDPGDWDASHDYYMEINACDPNGVYIEAQEMGVNWGNGVFTICSLGAYEMEKGKSFSEVITSGVMGKLVNGVITFPVKGLLAKLGDRGWYYGNLSGAFKVILPTHQEINTDYYPFIEEGKVWKEANFMAFTGEINSYLYTYFEGDTIIDGRSCKKMYRGKTPYDKMYYMGAWYEEGRRVYYAKANTDQLILFYDYGLSTGDSFQFKTIEPMTALKGVVTKKSYINKSTFKGTCIVIAPYNYQSESSGYDYEHLLYWRERVGGYRVDDNAPEFYWTGGNLKTAACTIGDEVLYFDTSLTDFPSFNAPSEVKKQWLDFTHTVKTRPKAPCLTPDPSLVGEGSEEEETLTGEYSVKELFVNFKPLAGQYVVTICDDSGTDVYRKVVQTSNVIGLNTDISSYEKGDYTITVENEEEAYTANFKIDDTVGINGLTPDPSPVGEGSVGAVYDLSGRKVIGTALPSPTGEGSGVRPTLPRGVYIINGRKVVMK